MHYFVLWFTLSGFVLSFLLLLLRTAKTSDCVNPTDDVNSLNSTSNCCVCVYFPHSLADSVPLIFFRTKAIGKWALSSICSSMMNLINSSTRNFLTTSLLCYHMTKVWYTYPEYNVGFGLYLSVAFSPNSVMLLCNGSKYHILSKIRKESGDKKEKWRSYTKKKLTSSPYAEKPK